MPKIKKLLFRSDTRREKYKKNFFDTPTKKYCHHWTTGLDHEVQSCACNFAVICQT